MMNPLLPFFLFAASVLVGIILRTVAVRSLLRAARRNEFLQAEAAIASIKNMIILWSVLAGISVSRMLTGVMRKRAKESHNASWFSSITRRLVQLGILGPAMLVIMSSLGLPISTLLAVFGIGSAAFALSLQVTLGNVFAGASITLGKQIRVGDQISMGATIKGELCDIGWRNSTMRAADSLVRNTETRDALSVHGIIAVLA